MLCSCLLCTETWKGGAQSALTRGLFAGPRGTPARVRGADTAGDVFGYRGLAFCVHERVYVGDGGCVGVDLYI